MKAVRDRVEQNSYEVDAEAVAIALVEQLLARRTVAPDPEE